MLGAALCSVYTFGNCGWNNIRCPAHVYLDQCYLGWNDCTVLVRCWQGNALLGPWIMGIIWFKSQRMLPLCLIMFALTWLISSTNGMLWCCLQYVQWGRSAAKAWQGDHRRARDAASLWLTADVSVYFCYCFRLSVWLVFSLPAFVLLCKWLCLHNMLVLYIYMCSVLLMCGGISVLRLAWMLLCFMFAC